MAVDLKDPTLRSRLKKMTEEEKLEVVDAIIDRDAEVWKRHNRERWCDFGYYFRFIESGVALTERQR